MIYKYETRYIVEFSNKSRASYSRQRYGPLLELVTQQAIKEDRKIWNPYIIEDDICHILYYEQKTNSIKDIIVDVEYKDLIYNYYFQLNHNGYPQTRTKGEKQYLHHIVMGTTQMLDHLNHNPLDNRKENLRVTTPSLNALNRGFMSNNTSGTVGVCWIEREQQWRARLIFDGITREEFFHSYEQAVEKRKSWEEEIYKQFY